ncbi:MAG TPA: protein kinase [Thermoanaerobaculia bacterium]|nr:protein kinase [Thermoanaerobaculia bacterium]
MKTKRVVLLCWVLVVLAVATVVLNCHSQLVRPASGFEYSRRTGKVVSVLRDGPAERAGIQLGDRIRAINGHAIGLEVYPFFFVRAGETVSVVVERDGSARTVPLHTISQEQLRRLQLRHGGVHRLAAISGYLNFPVHFWMLGLGIALLVVRPDSKDARLASFALVAWAGGMFMFRTYGFGVTLNAIPPIVRSPLLIVDGVFAAGFFAVAVHFALVFAGRRRGWWEVLPYAAALPIFIETVANNFSRMRGNVRPLDLGLGDAYSSVGTMMLLAALVILGIRLARAHDVNRRRRLQLVFLSMLPGSLAFILGFIFSLLQLGHMWQASARILHVPSTIVGSAIFAYAVVRHRMFNVRVLVRRSIQYALARSTLLVLMALPVFGLVTFLYLHRGDSLAALLTGTPAVYIVVLLPLALVIRYRKRLLESLDRRFFREQYDARRVLLHVVSIIRGGSDMLVLSRAALDEIDRALHPKHISLWQTDPEGVALHRGFWRGEEEPDVGTLNASGTLASLLSGDEEPLDVYGRATRAVLSRLPEGEREWLRAVDAHLLVPLLIESRVAGLLVLGERKSEEPYAREDRELLRTLASQLALTLDYARLKQSPSLVWSPLSGAPVHLHLSDALQLCPRCGRCYSPDERNCEYDDQQLVPESGVPRVIEDKYVVTKLLGRGGMGSVYLANQKRLNRNVAVKVLLSHLVGSSSMRSRFEREARIVARLRHPSIVTIHDFGVLPSGHAYLVMEYLDGDTLRKTIISGPQPMENALPILRPIGDAIDTAHRAGIVHRDLKPENIMLCPESPHVRVLDFGLAKMSGPIGEDEQTLVQSGHSAGVVGTLMYMAPEVLSGHLADARSDQYSLGIIAWELLAGMHPLGHATDLAAVVRGHTDRPMIPIRERVPSVPVHVDAAIARALSKKPDERFDSVSDFVRAMT